MGKMKSGIKRNDEIFMGDVKQRIQLGESSGIAAAGDFLPAPRAPRAVSGSFR